MPPPSPPLDLRWLGRVPYREAFELQKSLVEDRTQGRIPDTLLLLEHPPVITHHLNGRGLDHLLASTDLLAHRGVTVEPTDRGGDITFHGPGQLVGYPILLLPEDRRDLHRYLRDLEDVLIQTAQVFGITTERAPGMTGIWVGREKLAAIGVKTSSRWVTHHGFALNASTDLTFFNLIVPCGIADRGVTSLAHLLNREVSVMEAAQSLLDPFLKIFPHTLSSCSPELARD